MVKTTNMRVAVLRFIDSKGVEHFGSEGWFLVCGIENAQMNLKAEMLNKVFAQVAEEADAAWEALLSRFKLQVAWNVKRHCFILLSSMLFKWPAFA